MQAILFTHVKVENLKLSDGRFNLLTKGSTVANIYMHNYSVCLRKCFQGYLVHHETTFWLFLAMNLKSKIAKTTAEMIGEGVLHESERYEKRKCVLPGEEN